MLKKFKNSKKILVYYIYLFSLRNIATQQQCKTIVPHSQLSVFILSLFSFIT